MLRNVDDSTYKIFNTFYFEETIINLIFYIDPKMTHPALDSIFHYVFKDEWHNMVSCDFIEIRNIIILFIYLN